MIKIKYPLDALNLRAFNDGYYKKLSCAIGDSFLIDTVLAKISTINGAPLSLKKLLLAPFEQLEGLNSKINSLTELDKTILEPLSAYKDMQPKIASYFMEQDELKLSSCFYCNIDSIYSFSEFGDYRDPLDFIRRATEGQFGLVKGIGDKKAKIILAQRRLKQFNSLAECPVSSVIRKRIQSLNYYASHNHFTLDHFYHQAKYHYIRLCLYNFVPCCYACNSKFKIAAKLYSGSALLSSPTSSTFSFHTDVSFKIYLSVTESDVNSINDFTVDLVADKNAGAHAAYIKILKLQGRYVHHKREALRLLKLKIGYPDTVLEELANNLGKSVDELKRELFGAELYDSDYDATSLVKYKRDIAKDIKLIDI